MSVRPGTEQPAILAPLSASARYDLGPDSPLQQRIIAVVRNFDVSLPASNPQLLECFRTRNTRWNAASLSLTVAWTGEYPGKWLTHCAELWRLTQDPELQSVVQNAVDKLAAYQATDGYLAPWADSQRWSTQHWDTWGHYHCMIGCLLWNEATGDPTALSIARKIGDVVCAYFSSPQKLFAQGGLEQNMAILHSVARLYTRTREKKLLDFCNVVLAELQMPPAGDYLRNALNGRQFYQGSQTRWEALCGIMGFAELTHATSDGNCRAAYQQIWWSLCEYERHNHGGVLSNEAAAGSPYATGSVETCCTVTWGAMCVEMLRLTGDSVVADELELSLFNAGLFLLSPSGRWCVYDSPMNGQRASTTIEIGTNQNKAGCSELSCCAVNGPRMVGLPADWACMAFGGGGNTAGKAGFALNLYGEGTIVAPFTAVRSAGAALVIVQKTKYPLGDGSVSITLTSRGAEAPPEYDLWLRIPCWSKLTTARLNGHAVQTAPSPGQYLRLAGLSSSATNVIALQLDFRVRCWLQPITGSPDSESAEGTAHNVQVSAANQLLAPPLPTPLWTSSSAGWKEDEKVFAVDGSDVIVVPGSTAINAGTTTGCAWFGGIDWFAGGSQQQREVIAFSFGATDTGPGFSRALSLSQGQINYLMYEGTKPAGRDMVGIVDNQHVATWNSALRDGGWHHLAIMDDGQDVTLMLDGQNIGGGTHHSPPHTSAGAIVGGWGISHNRDYAGGLAGVELYTSKLSVDQIRNIMQRSKPSGSPPATPRMGCFYRGPLLLGLDPAYNPTISGISPILDPTKLATPTQVKDEAAVVEPFLLMEVPTADGASESSAAFA